MPCLIDTGADINLISETCFQSSSVCQNLRVFKSKYVRAVTANGSTLNIVGLAYTPLIISGTKFSVPMHITSNLDRDLIIRCQISEFS